jgi:uncharacterized protein YecE (DUF72 family)
MAEALRAASARGKKAYSYANNHKNAQAVVNAAQLKELVGQELSTDLPELVAARSRSARQRQLLL